MERFNSKKNSYDANQDKIGQKYGNKIDFAILCILCMAINFVLEELILTITQ